MIELYSHQKEIINEDVKKTGLFLQTGSAKTIIALMLAKGTVLVVCPKTQKLDKTWERNLGKIESSNIPHNVQSLTVVSKEKFRRDYEMYSRYETLIFDECHEGILGATPQVTYRERVAYPKTSQLFEAARQFIRRMKPDRIYLVTATPVRAPMAVWAAGVLLGRWDMDSFFRFRDIYYFPMPTDRRIFLARSDKATKERLGKVVRSLGYTGQLSDWVDVPDQTYKDVKVGLTKEQEKKLEEIPLLYPDPLVGTQKMYQVECGFLMEEGEKTEVFRENYTKALWDYYEEFGKLFIVVLYTWQIDYIEAFFKKKKVNTFVISGQRKEREVVLEDANKAESGVVIAQAQVTSGYELPSYPCTIFVSLDHRVVSYIQACGRVLRRNALKKNLYIHIITGEQSEARLNSVKNKEDFNRKIYAEKKYKELTEK